MPQTLSSYIYIYIYNIQLDWAYWSPAFLGDEHYSTPTSEYRFTETSALRQPPKNRPFFESVVLKRSPS